MPTATHSPAAPRASLRKGLIAALLVILGAPFFHSQPEACAQRTYDPKLYIGAKAGAAMSSVAFTPHVKQSLSPGMLVGVTAKYTEERLFGLVGELLITQRGWKENFEGAPFDYHRKLTYLTLPVLTNISFGSETFKGFVNLGASVSYMLASSTTANFDYTSLSSLSSSSLPGFPEHRSIEQLALPIKNKFDYGIAGGLGAQITLRRRHTLLIEGRYYFGLGNIFGARKKDPFSSSRNTSIEVSLAYLLRVR